MNRARFRCFSRVVVVGVALAAPGVSQVSAQSENWDQVAELNAPDPQLYSLFGKAVALSGDTAIIGSPYYGSLAVDAGKAYAFVRDPDGTWRHQASFVPRDLERNDEFGKALDIDGDTAVIGAFALGDLGERFGKAYVYRRTGDQWSLQARITPNDPAPGRGFGTSLAIDGDVFVAGVWGDDTNGSESGAAYIFRRTDNRWIQEAKIFPDDPGILDGFGHSVAIQENLVAVGSPWDDDEASDSGSVWIFEYDGSRWQQTGKIAPADGQYRDLFGYAISIEGDSILISAREDDDNGRDFGSAYVFTRQGHEWVQEAKILPRGMPGRRVYFGLSVALDGDTALIGAPFVETATGAAFLFVRSGERWLQQEVFTASDGAIYDVFGVSVDLDGPSILVGAGNHDHQGPDTGAVYIFETEHAPLYVNPDPLVAASPAGFTATQHRPDQPTFLAYSTIGRGETYVPFLDVTLDLATPARAGQPVVSNQYGTADWRLNIPGAAAGHEVWFQTCQYQLKSNVIMRRVEP